MANARDEGRNFLRVYSLENFKIFNPRYKECLTGREWAMLMYLLNNRLLYIRRDEDFMNGNWIKMDAKEKDKLMKTLYVFKLHLCAESRNDVETTKQICSASELMGITMLDHIVIARAEEGREEYAYFSMKDHGLMQK